MLRNARCPILGFAAYSGTGKTTLLTRLLPLLTEQGIRVGMVKHAHHRFEMDHPGKDSYELRRAGAQQMLVASRKRFALLVEHDNGQAEPDLDTLLAHLDQDRLDLILVEGFKHERFPKIELHRPALGKPLLFPDHPGFIAVASDAPLPIAVDLPILSLNRPEQVRDFIIERLLHRNRMP
jgi:molybdopterin-guanine dinucleotide biosynthesis protein B